MNKDLTSSAIARKNVLNNPYALEQLESNLELGGLEFEGETLFTKFQAAEILAIDDRTIDRNLNSDGDELKANGHQVLKGKLLKSLRLRYVNDTSPKAPSLGVHLSGAAQSCHVGHRK